jgi:hypothetical protein
VDFSRALVEVRQKASLGRGVFLTVGAGAGVARGVMDAQSRIVDTGSFPGTDDFSQRRTFSGFSWEAGPGLAYEGQRLGAELRVVYASFPEMPEDTTTGLRAFRWNPLGVKLSVSF